MTHALHINELLEFDDFLFKSKNVTISFLREIYSYVAPIKFGKSFGVISFLQKSIYKDLGKLMIDIKGLNSSLSQSEIIEINEVEYKQFQAFFDRINHIYAKLNRINFLDSSDIKEMSDNIVMEFYDVDFKIRDIVYADTPIQQTEPEVLKYFTDMSLKSALQLVD